MDDFTPQAFEAARAPIASLMSKSEKAQGKVAPGTWQHTMLRANIAALRIALNLMDRQPGQAGEIATADLDAALEAIASMIVRTEQAQPKFPEGTSQHTLLRNRLSALRVAEALVRAQRERA